MAGVPMLTVIGLLQLATLYLLCCCSIHVVVETGVSTNDTVDEAVEITPDTVVVSGSEQVPTEPVW